MKAENEGKQQRVFYINLPKGEIGGTTYMVPTCKMTIEAIEFDKEQRTTGKKKEMRRK